MNDKNKIIDFFAWRPHHFDHLLPIWKEIPWEYKGEFVIYNYKHSISDYNLSKEEYSIKKFDDLNSVLDYLEKSQQLLITASIFDGFIEKLKRPIGLVEHGAGQYYKGKEHLLFPLRKNVILDILPNDYTASIIKHVYQNNNVAVVGCPKLDYWHTNFKKNKNEKTVIAISFHYDRMLVPETRTSFPHFQKALPELALEAKKRGWEILGHGHPQMIEELIPHYKELGFEIVKNFHEVLTRADLYICDHMSTLYEFASTNRPVVVLNAPWYRRNVEHGLRYWEHADVGVNCNEPEELIENIEVALIDSKTQKQKREKAVNAVYKFADGTASKRASDAIIHFVENQKIELPNYIINHFNRDYCGLESIIKRDIINRVDLNEGMVIFGAGEHTKCLLEKVSNLNLNIIGIIDNDKQKHGKRIMGLEIYPKNMIQTLNPKVIIISSEAYESEIYDELVKKYNNIFIYPLYKSNKEFEKDIFLELYS